MQSRILTVFGLIVIGLLFWASTNTHHHLLHGAYTCSHEEVPDSNIQMLFPTIPYHQYEKRFAASSCHWTDGFDFPVGRPDANGYYKALEFGQKRHLGEDWNGLGGGNTDLGDPVYSSANGLVVFSKEVCCGWGNVIRIVHYLPEASGQPYVESIYAHLDQLSVQPGDWVKRGQTIGTIGNVDGKYKAHLHFEMRDFVAMSLGPGYGEDRHGYLIPTSFIQKHRPEIYASTYRCTN